MPEHELMDKDFSDYRILRKIGDGAMADVYLAEQNSLGRRVALKILKPDLAGDETTVRRFVREAKAIASVVHPNLVQIYQADCWDGFWFIAQEYVPGQSLQQAIQRTGPLPCHQVADILWHVSAAMEKTSQEGIVHRDIKPENILLDDTGNVKLADFGLARLEESENAAQDNASPDKLALTQVGMTLGTPLYMSPEQAQGKKLDQRSDIYSLGVTCYHALAGQPPFRAETALAVALMHVNETPEMLATLRPDLPVSLARIVHRMLEKKPEDRFQSFHDVLVALQHFLTEQFDAPNTPFRLADWNRVTRDKQSQSLSRRRRLRDSVFAGCIALVVLLVTLLGGFGLGYWKTSTLPNPLAEPAGHTVRHRDTVEEQWVYACMLNSADAWQAVIDYFPEDNYLWGRKARRQLIRVFFHGGERGEGDLAHARPLFREFAELSDLDVDDQALGLAGLAWCAAESGESEADMDRALGYLRRLYGLDFSYDDELLLQILDAANRAIQRHEAIKTTEKTREQG